LSDQPIDNRLDLSTVQLGALIAVMLFGFASSLGAAFNLDAIAISFNAGNDGAGNIASVELLGIAVSSLVFAQLSTRLNAHRTFTVGLVVVIAMNVLAIFVPGLLLLAICRLVTGLALGAIVATVMATAGRSRSPEMTFAWINASVAGMGMILGFLLPRALSFHHSTLGGFLSSESDGLFFVYALFGLVALFFIRKTPIPKPIMIDRSENAAAPQKPPMIGWISLVGLAVVFLGHGFIAFFFMRIGREIPLEVTTVGYVAMAASGIGMFVALGAGVVGAKYKAKIPIGIIFAILIVLAPFVAAPQSPIIFFLTAPLFIFLPMAMMPIYLGALARVDPSGRLTASHPAFATLPGAAAPAIGGYLSIQGGFTLNGWAAIACIIIGAGLMAATIFQADRIRTIEEAP
jgi:predicted MFS family arabinose efflux permease